MLLGIVASAGATVLIAHIIQPILDDIFIAKDKEMLYIIPPFLILIYVVKSAGRYFQTFYTSFIGLSIVAELRKEMLKKILDFDFEYINSLRSGELQSRLNGDVTRVRYVVSEMIPELSREIVTVFSLMGYIIYQNPVLAFYTLVVLPATFYPLSVLAKKMKKVSFKMQEKSADLFSRLSEILNNIEIIKANSTEKYELGYFEKENKEVLKFNIKGVKVLQFISPMMEIYSSFSMVLVIVIGGEAVIDGEMSVGSFFAFLTAVGLLFNPIKKISTLFNKMQEGISATERIKSFLEIEQKIKSGSDEVSEIRRIEFRDVSFHFGEKEILSSVSFSVNRGQKIALIGNSGGGKSSILNLILRFYERSGGDIWLNGKNIENVSFQSLRNEISFVSQKVYIFNDTVAKNVAYGSDLIDKERVVKSLKFAEAIDFVEKMENGIETVLSEFGTNLSGGQRQRIAIARAIYKRSSIMIFDEATSALDNRVEQKILQNLENKFENQIVITVAHRLSTIENSDSIFLFENGKIVASGNDRELLENCQKYRDLKMTKSEN
ncbi:ABC-type multidrug transport system, ATPase and permease component [Thiovulum sp. ES]|nr:ABC-type multidrug transport system, ATPase and permease component [Thiovulum sp. ES]